MRTITEEKLNHYFDITGQALKKAKQNITKDLSKKGFANDFLDMAQRYYDDANYFKEKNDYVNAFAALSYAHGWLDAGARIKLFNVNDSRLFTVDD
ncbi:MAG: DUF357 domain-containing protein [Candidatus Nanoarchaeia archaeon]|nr:DUF357 domain-containing protein [Candidatus Nanoarchaeia archaeon]